MDSTGLRLVLLVAGILLIVGIYGWDKIKKRLPSMRRSAKGSGAARLKRRRRFRKVQHEEDLADTAADRVDPIVEPWGDDDTAFGTEVREPVLDFGDPLDDEPIEPEPASNETTREPEPDRPSAALPLPEVLVVHVAARVGGRFPGDALMTAARGLGMEVGSMEIFHLYDEPSGEVLFSMANMVKPGTFPFENMSDFSTPGVAIFAQLPGPLDALATYDLLLETVERLAASLDGRLLDEKRRPLTREARGRMRLRLGGAAEE